MEETLVLANRTVVQGNFAPANGPPEIATFDSGRGVEFVPVENALAEVALNGSGVQTTIPVGSNPEAVAYDPAKGELFVTNTGSDNVTVVSNSTLKVVASINVGSNPYDDIFDPATGDVFVSNSWSNDVSVISTSTNTVLRTVPVGSYPEGLAYDSHLQDVVVANFNSANISFISGSTLSVVAQVAVGAEPDSIAFDSGRGEEFVADDFNISVVNDSTFGVTRTIADSGAPVGLAYDAARGEIYVADEESNRLRIISDSNNSTIRTVPVGMAPTSVAYNVTSGTIVVSDWSSWSLSFISASNDTIVATVETGTGPNDVAVDTQTGVVYVANGQQSQILGISPHSARVLSEVEGVNSWALAYDAHSQEIFSADWTEDNVSEFNATTGGPVTNISLGASPYAIAYDSGKHEIFVGSYTAAYTGVVEVINDSTLAIVANISVPYSPSGIAYDSGTGQVFVACDYANVVDVINDSSNTVVARVITGGQPDMAVYDAARHVVYVADFITGKINVISDTSDKIVANISAAGGPFGMTIETQVGLLLVVNSIANNLTVASDATDTDVGSLGSLPYPNFIRYDPLTGQAYITGAGTVTILDRVPWYSINFNETGLPSGDSWSVELDGLVISSAGSSVSFTRSNGTYSYSIDAPAGYVVNPASGSVSIDGQNLTIWVNISRPITITFKETGLPAGAEWWVNLSGGESNHTKLASIGFGLANGSYEFWIAAANKVYEAAGGNLTVAGSATNLTVQFATVTSTVRFVESGLPDGTGWWANLSGVGNVSSSKKSISFNATNGSYSYLVGTGSKFVADPLNGSIAVMGSTIKISVSFYPLYGITFSESGLPAGTSWTVQLANGTDFTSSNSTVQFVEPDGTYPYLLESSNLTYAAPSGTFTVNGSNVSEDVSFAEVQYSILFIESGLPAATEWWVNLSDGESFHATAGSVAFAESNGTYPFSLATTNKSYAGSSGSFTVNGAGVSKAVEFDLVLYSITFTESGLPSGSEWWLNLTDGQSFVSRSAEVVFSEPNGSYSYRFSTANRTFEAPGGSFVVEGAALSETTAFSIVTYSVTFNQSGLPTGTQWWVNLSDGSSFSSTGEEITFVEDNGSYLYDVSAANPTYAASGGSFSIEGQGASIRLAFARVVFSVTLTESGLPSGDEWWVNLTDGQSFSSTGGSIAFQEPNGSYLFSIGVSDQEYAASASAFVVEGGPVGITITFSLVTAEIEFTESGLSNGAEWWVNVSTGQSVSSTGSEIVLMEPNGSYSYSVASAGWIPDPASGVFVVSGTAVTRSISFSQSLYGVSFIESGLPNGTTWSVTLNGRTLSSDTDAINFEEANGTYTFSIGTVPDFSTDAGVGVLSVSGASRSIDLTFVPESGAGSGGGSPGSRLGPAVLVAVAVITIALAALAAVWVLRRQKRSLEPSPSNEDPGGLQPPDEPPAEPIEEPR